MSSELISNNGEVENLTALQMWDKLYNKKLDCKKNIIEYIDIIKALKKDSVSEEQIKDTYNYIYKQIEGLKDSIKPNTMMYLKNNLKSQLGKYVKEKDPRPVNHFIEFFKKAYPENARRKEFTWVLMDINRISEEQVWTTLVYINRECLNNNLSLDLEQKKDITAVIEKSITNNNIKYINDVRTLKRLTDELKISIVSAGKEFKVKHNK